MVDFEGDLFQPGAERGGVGGGGPDVDDPALGVRFGRGWGAGFGLVEGPGFGADDEGAGYGLAFYALDSCGGRHGRFLFGRATTGMGRECEWDRRERCVLESLGGILGNFSF